MESFDGSQECSLGVYLMGKRVYISTDLSALECETSLKEEEWTLTDRVVWISGSIRHTI